MLCPYKGAALSTLERIKGTVTSYYVNQIYKNEQYNLYWFINSKGYVHVLKPCKVLLNGKFLHYAIEDNLLTTDNMVQSKGTDGKYSTRKETIEELERRLHNERL